MFIYFVAPINTSITSYEQSDLNKAIFILWGRRVGYFSV